MNDGARFIGEPVTVSGIGDLAVGHGRFRLENPGPAAVHVAVDSATLDVGGRERRLEVATVFDADRDEPLEPTGFEIAPGTLTFLLGFPWVADASGPGETTEVHVRLNVDGAPLDASSRIVFERRIPRR